MADAFPSSEIIGTDISPIQGGHQFHLNLNLNPFNIVEIEVTCINSTNST
jgi:hypothetical protein